MQMKCEIETKFSGAFNEQEADDIKWPLEAHNSSRKNFKRVLWNWSNEEIAVRKIANDKDTQTQPNFAWPSTAQDTHEEKISYCSSTPSCISKSFAVDSSRWPSKKCAKRHKPSCKKCLEQ